ncbi:hypothetical protein L226DRAFT_372271 [Lentinus tigrinus ALCF2SS1-7]|uniref:Uncharacterized protein n=1 Tax=Lentinus tigrinus ALCF2SS1-6 TaxID=1328759 RepID=A0A5C2SLB8_9APHY|nr:hypothetical protein L227DRAFT_317530 [Lentinus tigrinus ALCF2SS1-6]RPD76288.1 hypothetical protein L226DRAFT_372271 [Lentinus tigrinus ALCF2SS1-7]
MTMTAHVSGCLGIPASTQPQLGVVTGVQRSAMYPNSSVRIPVSSCAMNSSTTDSVLGPRVDNIDVKAVCTATPNASGSEKQPTVSCRNIIIFGWRIYYIG